MCTKAKRDYGIKGWQVIPVNIYDIEDCENWAFDGMTLVNADKQDKESEILQQSDILQPIQRL